MDGAGLVANEVETASNLPKFVEHHARKQDASAPTSSGAESCLSTCSYLFERKVSKLSQWGLRDQQGSESQGQGYRNMGQREWRVSTLQHVRGSSICISCGLMRRRGCRSLYLQRNRSGSTLQHHHYDQSHYQPEDV